MKPRRRGLKIGLALALGGGIFAWFYLNRPMPIEFPEDKPPLSFISAHDIERKPWLNFKLAGKPIIFPRPFELAYPASGIEAVAGYLDFEQSNSLHQDVHFEDPAGKFVYSPTAWIRGEPSTVSSPTSYSVVPPLSSRPATAYPANARAIYGVPYATEEKFRSALLIQDGASWPVKLPVSTEFGPSIRKPTTGKCGPWTLTLTPQPWKLSTAPFQTDIMIDAPKEQLFVVDYLPIGTLGVLRGGEPLRLSLKYLKDARLQDLLVTEVTATQKAVYLRKVRQVNNAGYRSRFHIVDSAQKELYREGSPSVLAQNGLAAILCAGRTFFEDGSSLAEPGARSRHFDQNEPVLATVYAKGKTHRVNMVIDIPPLLTKPFMRDR